MKIVFKIKIFLYIIIFFTGNLFSQINFLESFSGAMFPPEGWSHISVVSGVGTWYRYPLSPLTARSDFSLYGGDNYLVTKRFIPDNDDSLSFLLTQLFPGVYQDSLEIRISTTDSLVNSFSTRLLVLKDGVDYAPPNVSKRFAIYLGNYSGQTAWIAFRHADLNGESIFLDDVMVGRLPANVVAPANYYPIDTIPTDNPFTPVAKFTNAGSEHQLNPFTVTYKISGPLNYTSTKTIDNLLVGQTVNITFDTIYNAADTGLCTAEIYSSISSDQDTSIATFHLSPRNWGRGSCDYWWANSEPGGFQFHGTRPKFTWRDTTGSTSIIVNSTDVSGGLFVGNFQRGYVNLGTHLGQNAGNKCIKVCGINYTGFYPTLSGLIGLTYNNTVPHEININPSRFFGPSPAIYVLGMDFYYTVETFPNRLSYKLDTVRNELLITWDKITYENLVSGSWHVSYQACIELKDCDDKNASNSNIRFNYSDTTSGRTGMDFLNAYSNFGTGNYYEDHLIGIKPETNAGSLIYRYRFYINQPPGWLSKTGPLFAAPNKGSLSVEFGPNPDSLNKFDNKILSLRMSLEGLQNNYNPRTRDTVKITLRNSVSPYSIVETQKGYLDTLGNINFQFSNTIPGENYYVVTEHRNSIRTWSFLPQNFIEDTLRFDFTTSVSQAYGNNMTITNGLASFFTGDINQDGVVDVTDATLIDNDIINFVSSDYIATDLNWDGIVDIGDAALTDNNSFNFVAEIRP